jgi:hypothetical protein
MTEPLTQPQLRPDPRQINPHAMQHPQYQDAPPFFQQHPSQQFQPAPMQMPPQPPARPMNPLSRHFRQPTAYIKLTSEGKFWPAQSLDMPVTGELPVFPMTAKDEIILRTPDALMNGASVVQVIESCVPNIKNAWDMPSIDVDSTLIAIRVASYGQHMSVSAKCPHCGEEHDYDVDLHRVLGRIRMPDYNSVIKTDDGLTIKLRPLTYLQVTKAGTTSFEEQRIIQSLNDENLSDEKKKEVFSTHMKKMFEVNFENLTNCTQSIVTADGIEVSDPTFINEFYQNAKSSVSRLVEDKVKEFAESVSIKAEETLCTSCNQQFKLNIEFDYSRFFAKGS